MTVDTEQCTTHALHPRLKVLPLRGDIHMSTLSPRPFMTERRNSAEDHELSRLDSTASTAPLLEGQGVPRATSPQQSILSARRPKGRRIRRAIYGSFLVFVGITWTIVVIMFERHELQQSKASLNQDVNGEVANGIIAGSVRISGGPGKFTESRTADYYERTSQKVRW